MRTLHRDARHQKGVTVATEAKTKSHEQHALASYVSVAEDPTLQHAEGGYLGEREPATHASILMRPIRRLNDYFDYYIIIVSLCHTVYNNINLDGKTLSCKMLGNNCKKI